MYLIITKVLTKVTVKFWIGKMHGVLAHSFTVPIFSRKTKVESSVIKLWDFFGWEACSVLQNYYF